MKKRILSLLLAFSMAATLAPATALVGGDVAKAANPTITATAVEDKIGKTVNIYRGTEISFTLADTANSTADNTVVTPTISGDTLSELSTAGSTLTFAANSTGSLKVAAAASGEKGDVTAKVGLAATFNGVDTTADAGEITFNIKKYVPDVTVTVVNPIVKAGDTSNVQIAAAKMKNLESYVTDSNTAASFVTTIKNTDAPDSTLLNSVTSYAAGASEVAGDRTVQVVFPAGAKTGEYTFEYETKFASGGGVLTTGEFKINVVKDFAGPALYATLAGNSATDVSSVTIQKGTKATIALEDYVSEAYNYSAGTSVAITEDVANAGTGAVVNGVTLTSATDSITPKTLASASDFKDNIVIDIPKTYAGTSSFVLTLTPSNTEATAAGTTGVAKKLRVNVVEYEANVTANWPALTAGVTGETQTDINLTVAHGAASYSGAKAYLSASSSAVTPATELFSTVANTGRPVGAKALAVSNAGNSFGSTVTFGVTVPTSAVPGTYTFTVTTRYSNSATGPVVSTYTINLIVGQVINIELDADGGEINDARFTKGSGSVYTAKAPKPSEILAPGATSAHANPDFELPRPTKTGYVFSGWVEKGTKTFGSYTAQSTDIAFTATWTADVTNIQFNAGSKGGAVTGGTGYTNFTGKIGDAIGSTGYFEKTGYTLEGWSTEDNANVAMWPVKTTVTDELLKALESANDGNTLYAVWKPVTYTINFKSYVPDGEALSASSRNMESITKTYGVDIPVTSWPRNTYHIAGFGFTGWYTSLNAAQNGNSVAVGPAPTTAITDAMLGYRGERTSVTLYTGWNDNDISAVLHSQETGSAPYFVISSSEALPDYSGKIGYAVDEWKNKDEVVTAVNANITSSKDLWPVYEKQPIEYSVVYDYNGGSSTGKYRDTMTVDDGSNALPSATLERSTFIGWQADIYNGNDEYVYTMPSIYKGSYKTEEIITQIWNRIVLRQRTATAAVSSNAYVVFTALYLNEVNGAALFRPTIKVAYGTPLSEISRMVGPFLTYTSKEFGRLVNFDVNFGIASLSWSNASSYNPTPKDKNGVYNLKGTVTVNSDVESKSRTYPIYAEVTVYAKDAGDNNVYAVEPEAIKAIELPKGANKADVIAALSNINTIGVKAEDGKTYKAAIVGNNSWVAVRTTGAAANALDYQNEYDNPAYDEAALTTAFNSAKTFLFRTDLSNLAAVQRANLTFVDVAANATGNTQGLAYTNKYAYVVVNIDGGSEEVVKPSDEDVSQDVLATTDEQALTLLEKNYTLRFRNKVTGEHLYTADWTEYVALMVNKNWEHETYISGSNTFKASTKRDSVYTTPVYRLFSSKAQEHLYTSDFGEVQELVTKGWSLDNSTIYVSMDESGTAYYRQVRNILINGKPALQHHYAPKAEFDANLASGKGWRADNEGKPFWYSPVD